MAFAGEVEQKCVLSDAVEGGLGHLFGAGFREVGEPFFERPVRCQNEAFLFVAVVSDEVEEELDGIGIAWWVAEFVEDDEVEFG